MTGAAPNTSFLSYSRWTLKRGADIAKAIDVFRDAVRPAYASVQGCLSLTLVEVIDEDHYLVIASWDTRDDYDAWAREADEWRVENDEAFKQWQAVMDFEEEFTASILDHG